VRRRLLNDIRLRAGERRRRELLIDQAATRGDSRNARVSTCCVVLFATSSTPISGTPGVFLISAAGAVSSCASLTSFASLTALVSAERLPASINPRECRTAPRRASWTSSSVISIAATFGLPSSPAIVVVYPIGNPSTFGSPFCVALISSTQAVD
jgi:hypothetical protein